MFSRTSQLIRLPSSILRQIAHRPMNQCAGLTLRQPFERLGGPRFVARQLLVLAHQPSDQGPVHATPDRLERRAVEMAVILLPSPQDRSEHGRKIGQALVVLQLDPPSPYG